MEAQPLALLVILATRIFAGANIAPPLGAGGIMLLELGLIWWAMLVEYLTRRVFTKDSSNALQFSGWIIALAVLIGPYAPSLLQGQDIGQALIVLALITWLWRRGIADTQLGFEYNRVALAFKIGFGIILGMLFIVTVSAGLPLLRGALPTALPIFFLSGLIAISLVRLGTLRAARSGADDAHTDPARSWLLALSIFGAALIALVLIIEAIFSFSALEAIVITLAPMWSAISTGLYWLLYGLVFLLSPIFYLVSFIMGFLHETPAKPIQLPGSPVANRHIPPSSTTTAIIAQVIAVGRWVVLALILIAIFVIVVRTMRHWLRSNDDGGVEEIRERLDARSLLAERLREWRNRRRRQTAPGVALETLDPLSARARYRELLQEIALTSETLARSPAETPHEYQRRLQRHLRQHATNAQATPGEAAPTTPAILDTLTTAYAGERYGGKQTSDLQRRRLQDWMPVLLSRITGKPPRRGSSTK